MTGAVGFAVAHEYVHRSHLWQRAMGVCLLVQLNYGHFRVEHVFGHHRNVATPEDPATARRNESLYRFWVRSILTGWVSSWRIEARRLRNQSIGMRIMRNRLIHYSFLQLGLLSLVGSVFGLKALCFFLIQSAVAILLLEDVNYVEHYGLVRQSSTPGRFEPVQDHHSWDSAHLMTNWSLFNLGRHSDHHIRPNQPYPKLTNLQGARTLPYGYSTLILLAHFPGLWKKTMHLYLDKPVGPI